MSQDLLTQLAEYGTYCDELQTAVPPEEVEDVIESISSTSNFDYADEPRRLWLAGVAAAVFVLVALGGVAWLAQSVGRTPPATEGPALTTGDGPRLSFVQAQAPSDGLLQGGVWFKGALYVVSKDRFSENSSHTLFRSSDGLTWESLSGLPDSGDFDRSMLQTDGDRLVNVVTPKVGSNGIRSDVFIQVNTSTNGIDWVSSRISVPIPTESGIAGQFELVPISDSSDQFVVGKKGILLTATISLRLVADRVAMELTGMADGGEGIETEVVDIDLDRGVMTVRLWDTENGIEVGEVREIDLQAAGFSNAFSNLLDAMVTDPDWAPLVPGFIAQLTGEHGDGDVSVGYAWFSPDGVTWERVDRTGPLDGGEFAGIAATADGFIATATGTFRRSGLPPELRYLSESFDNSVMWRSTDGTTWTEATGLTSRHDFGGSKLFEWKGELVEHVGLGPITSLSDDTTVWTLEGQQIFADIPTAGMLLDISSFGLIGRPGFGYSGPDATEVLFSVDGASWNRWEPTEFSIGGSHDSPGEHMGDAWVVGVGDDFVVLQHRLWSDETLTQVRTLWVGTIE